MYRLTQNSDKKHIQNQLRAEWAQTLEVENILPQNQVFAKEAYYHLLLYVMHMYLVINEVHQNNRENYFVLDYAEYISQTAISIEKLQERVTIYSESVIQ